MLFRNFSRPKPVSLGLQPSSGQIYGHVFENPRTGLPRNLYWNGSVDFQPVQLDGETWECSLAFEWLTWPIKRWRDLDGMGLRNVSHPKLLECSLYLFDEHHPATLQRLELREDEPIVFEADFEAIADVDDGSGRRLFEVSGRCDLSFTGIIIVASNLQPEPASGADAQKVTNEFISLEDLTEPRSEEWRYVFEPVT